MEGAESPLEVLSRAATMVQENQAMVTGNNDDKKQTTKWKRDRKSRLPPEYSRKSQSPSPETADSPLDMTTRQRGLPPSYAQTMNNRSAYRATANRDELPSGISMCDPIIDEHFRRSLGNDYHTLFTTSTNNNVPKEPPLSPKEPAPKVVEFEDSTTGLSVDDHFAKALGDTWTKLNKKEELKKNLVTT